MRTIVPLFLSAVTAFPACAQFDYGGSMGGVCTKLWVVESDDSHEAAWVRDVGASGLCFSAFYRERYSDFVDLGLDLTLVHRDFSAGYSHNGLGGGNGQAFRAEVDQLYLGLKPEVRMDAKRTAVVRFGLMVGVVALGSAKGSSSTWSLGGQGSSEESADFINHLNGGLRFAIGFGFRFPVGRQWAITIDPETTFSITSMAYPLNLRGSDAGLRIGLSRRCNGRALTSLFKLPPTKEAAGRK